MRPKHQSRTLVVLLLLSCAITLGLNILILVAGVPGGAIPRFYFTEIRLSPEAVEARENFTTLVSQPSSPVFLLYINSYCTANFEPSDVPLYNTNTNTSSQFIYRDIDFGSQTCYNYSLGSWFNFQKEFQLPVSCSKRCTEKFRKKVVRISGQYFATLFLLFILILWNSWLYISTHHVNVFLRLMQIAFTVTIFALCVNSSSIETSHNQVRAALRNCFPERVNVNGGGIGLHITRIASPVAAFIAFAITLIMLIRTDGRRSLPYTRLSRKYRGDGSGGGGGDGGGSGDGGGGGGGGGDGGGC